MKELCFEKIILRKERELEGDILKKTENIGCLDMESLKTSENIDIKKNQIDKVLENKKYSKLRDVTKKNIIKYYPDIDEKKFDEAYEFIKGLDEQGLVKNFEGTFYSSLKKI